MVYQTPVRISATTDLPDPSLPSKWLMPLARHTSAHREGFARWFLPYPRLAPTQRPSERVLSIPLLKKLAFYVELELYFPPLSSTSAPDFEQDHTFSAR